jgi:hypothetical protein
MSIHRIPLQSFVYEFEIKKNRILIANKVIQMNSSSWLLIKKDNTMQYISLK